MQPELAQQENKPAQTPDLRGARVALLLARSSITGASDAEMQRLCQCLEREPGVAAARFAYSEQGSPSLRETLSELARQTVAEVVLLPLVMPMEPGFRIWVARGVERWRRDAGALGGLRIRLATAPADSRGFEAWLRTWLNQGLESELASEPPPTPAGSVVPPQLRRVLLCQGGPCNDAGAALIWGHLRNEQKRLNLRTSGVGVMTCKTTCLGPCNLAPVMQVFPEGTYYGGVDEAGVDRIVQQHLLGNTVVADLAYAPIPGRQVLRAPGPGSEPASPAAANDLPGQA